MRKLTENTFIPVGLAVLVIGSSAAWVTRTSLAIINNQDSIQLNKSKLESIGSTMTSIDKRLDRIEWALGIRDKEK